MARYTEEKEQRSPFTTKVLKIPTCPRCGKNNRIVFKRRLHKEMDNSYISHRVGSEYRINCECGRIGEYEKTEDKALKSFMEYRS